MIMTIMIIFGGDYIDTYYVTVFERNLDNLIKNESSLLRMLHSMRGLTYVFKSLE